MSKWYPNKYLLVDPKDPARYLKVCVAVRCVYDLFVFGSVLSDFGAVNSASGDGLMTSSTVSFMYRFLRH